jgi:hypothetical protein
MNSRALRDEKKLPENILHEDMNCVRIRLCDLKKVKRNDQKKWQYCSWKLLFQFMIVDTFSM